MLHLRHEHVFPRGAAILRRGFRGLQSDENRVCESVFSTLKKHVYSKHRTVLTDTHVKELLRVATTEYKPDLKRIVQGKECQKSH